MQQSTIKPITLYRFSEKKLITSNDICESDTSERIIWLDINVAASRIKAARIVNSHFTNKPGLTRARIFSCKRNFLKKEINHKAKSTLIRRSPSERSMPDDP